MPRTLTPSKSTGRDTSLGRLPTWDEARSFAEEARSKAKEAVLAAIACGRTLSALRADIGAIPGKRDHLADGEAAWHERIEHELGISRATAYRWMADAERYDLLLAMSEGRQIEADGKIIQPSTETREAAEEILAKIHAGEIRPGRAWAGIQGALAAADRATQTGLPGGGKAATDHHANIRVALTKLKTSLSKDLWRAAEADPHGLPCDWDTLKNEWGAIVRNLPDELREHTRRLLG